MYDVYKNIHFIIEYEFVVFKTNYKNKKSQYLNFV